MATPHAKLSTLFAGPVGVDLESRTVSVELPGGGQVSVGPGGAHVSVPGTGQVSFGPGGGSVDTPAGRVEVRPDGIVLLPDGSVWNSRGPGLVDVVPSPSGPVPVPYPNFANTPITIPIPVPHFVVERIDIPVAVPRFMPQNVDLPLPIPHLQPTPVELPWPFPSLSFDRLPGPLPRVPELTPSLGPPAPFTSEIKAAIAQAVEEWSAGAEVTHGSINGSFGVIPAGALRSGVDFKAVTRAAMKAGGVPLETHGQLGDRLAEAWTDYFSAFATVIQYPAFVMWPGPVAGPIPALGQPLCVAATSNAGRMTAMALYAAGLDLSGAAIADGDLEPAWRQLSGWFAARFVSFTAATMLMNVLGTGPVPLWAPPPMPAGPVQGGTIVPSPGVLVGPNPFIVF